MLLLACTFHILSIPLNLTVCVVCVWMRSFHETQPPAVEEK